MLQYRSTVTHAPNLTLVSLHPRALTLVCPRVFPCVVCSAAMDALRAEIVKTVRGSIGPFAAPDYVQVRWYSSTPRLQPYTCDMCNNTVPSYYPKSY